MKSFIKSVTKKIVPLKVRGYLRCLRKRALRLIFYLMTRNPFLERILNYLLCGWVECLNFERLENYASTHPQNVELISDSLTSLYYSCPRYDGDFVDNYSMTEVTGHNKYAAILKNATVIGGSNVILLDNTRAMYELKYLDRNNKFWYTDDGIECCKNNKCLLSIKRSDTVFDEAIDFTGNFSWNYYHLMYDVLAKFEQLDSLRLNPSIPILIDSKCLDVPQYLELFTLLNTNGRKLIGLDRAKRYSVKHLYHFSLPNIIPPNYIDDTEIEASDVLFDLQTLEYLRSKLLYFAGDSEFPERIFISRSIASTIRQYNEEEVFAILRKYNFVRISPQEYSIADQIAMFNNADFIAGGTGGAFTNLLFCKESCKVVIFTNYKWDMSIFSTIADYAGADLTYLSDDFKSIDNTAGIHDDFTINCNRLNEIVSEWAKSASEQETDVSNEKIDII